MKKLFPMLLLSALLTVSLLAADRRAMTPEDLWAMKRIGDIALSPDGKWIAFSQTCYSMEKNSGNSDVWLIPAAGGTPRQLTTSAKYDGAPQWLPDGSALSFLSSRDGSNQLYLLPLDGGEARAITSLPVDVDDYLWSADGKQLLFTATVYADAASLAESAARVEKRNDSKVKARTIDHLFFRSFNHYREGMRSHLFLCDARGENLRDLTPGEYDTPPLDLGGSRDFAFSPDGSEVTFVRNADPMPAAQTNNDLFLLALAGGEPHCITAANKAVDNNPLYSPDGRYIAYKAMRRPGFEADQEELMLYDRATGQSRSLTDAFDQRIGEVIWAPDSKSLYLTANHHARNCIFRADVATAVVTEVLHQHVNSAVTIAPDGRTLYFKQQSATAPDDIYSLDLAGGAVRKLTAVNQELLDQLALNPVEDFWFASFDKKQVHGLLIKPPFFDPAKKYPLIYLIHGGPQGAFEDDFHYRWNPALFSAPGYVVAFVNFRGSTGYGQAWTDAVSKDWGGGPYQDLMAGIDYLLKSYPFIDGERMAAAGGSYGGFMVNWIATHTNRFKALVTHAGVFDQLSMYGATEELWFPEWEFGGVPYQNPELFRKWSASTYVDNFRKFKTPTLVVHGEQDYRVPYTQGLQMFTALQRMGVPSRLLLFPDETHFVLKPQNARLWWQEVHGWIGKWTK
jgi:dipeptidyl aminopeptidase/acylaminoacyl peptidase